MTQQGAQLYTVRMHMQTPQDVMTTFQKVRDLGFDKVQVSGVGKEVPMEAVADALAETGLTCIVTHVQYDDIVNDFAAILKKHDLWNCEYVGIGGLPARYYSKEGYKSFAKEASEVAKKLADHGKKFVYHNHHHEFLLRDGVRGMDILLNETDPLFQFELDLFWLQRAGADPIEYIKKVQGRGDIIHYKDMDLDSELNIIMSPVGYGNMNYEGIIRASNECGVKYAFIEQDVCQEDPFTCLKKSHDWLAAHGVLDK